MTSEDDVTRHPGVRLFFPARESGLLTSESRTLTLHEGDSAVEAIMSALMEGPQTESLSPLLPEGFQMLTVRVESGTCYLNLPRSDVSLLPEGLEAQQLLVRGLVNSLCSANGVDGSSCCWTARWPPPSARWTSAAPCTGSDYRSEFLKKSVLPAGSTLF